MSKRGPNTLPGEQQHPAIAKEVGHWLLEKLVLVVEAGEARFRQWVERPPEGGEYGE